jgi:hypothetical protein
MERSTDSNCNAAMLEGKPCTIQVISQGRSFARAVLLAPPLELPLCCANLENVSAFSA